MILLILRRVIKTTLNNFSTMLLIMNVFNWFQIHNLKGFWQFYEPNGNNQPYPLEADNFVT